MKKLIAKYFGNKLARNTSWMLVAQAIGLLIQAAYFVIIARSLGVQQYGAFVAVTALAQILSPFVGLGRDNLLIKNVAHDTTQFESYYGNLLVVTMISGLVSAGFVIGAARFILPASIPLSVLVPITFAELLFSRLFDCTLNAFQAVERLDVTAKLTLWSVWARLIGIAVLAAIVHHPTVRQWSFVYLLAIISSAVLGLFLVQVGIGAPRPRLRGVRGEFVEGVYFSISLSAENIYNNIDKTMLARMATLDAVGIYAAAYRVIDVACIPVRSLLSAAFPAFFRAGHEGVCGALNYMRRLLPKSAVYSSIAFICLIVSAPIVPYVFGHQYERTVEAIRWLALLPLLKTIRSFLADVLTCSDHQGWRTLIQVIVAGVNVLINLWIIPRYSWRGAAWSTLASDSLLAVSMYIVVWMLNARPIRSAVTSPSTP